jgi:DeoR family glycerol-3-phosphate regulon repressor
MNVNQRAKLSIATEVASLIADGDTIALDTGSTTGFIAQALRQHRGLTVVSNSSFIATSLATIPGNRVHMAGVELRNHDGASFDHSAFAVVAAMRVRYAILSTSAVDRKRGCMVHELCEAEMSATMADIAETRIVAVDHSKFDTAGLVALAPMSAGDIVVTERRAPRGFARVLAPATIRIAPAI